jgi:hypothetical protein
MKVVDLKKLCKFVIDNFLFEFIKCLNQSIYTQFVIIYREEKHNTNISEVGVKR